MDRHEIASRNQLPDLKDDRIRVLVTKQNIRDFGHFARCILIFSFYCQHKTKVSLKNHPFFSLFATIWLRSVKLE